MPNEGFLELTLLTVDAEPARDPSTRVTFQRVSDGQTIGSATTSFPPSRRFRLPAFPQEKALSCFIAPKRYRHRNVGVFTLTDGETITRQPTVFRDPKQWAASFVKWDELGAPFLALTDVLDESDDLRIKGGKVYEKFVEDTYDQAEADGQVAISAKASLLNLFAKLNSEKEPVHNRKSWFSFVLQLLEIGRERLIALVDEEMLVRVREIDEHIGRYEEYERTPAGNHFKNIPSGYTAKKSDMVSIKTDEAHGNLQLTLAPARDASGTAVTILDTDIDENGEALAHLADLFKHKVTGGTHPFDIHEYLLLEDKTRPLGYRLV